ncbi:DNA-binding transcriptional regulator, PucR family [Dethiosulfatibacter aminovorans DSM 17477]|uniref:DNA-binding transcriptional regulator, PucR family n=1 Tax=Dethiosulfatibacter aminovorans DSM 17477 TaxID=1121476 RepID=A0A1M6BRI3_9FIRM|nr:helix-turn-helix domain-containing protein [Dethiosulfatibacter aminovorans]SHI51316.1 DNA-binding transcriptional regulator, PucR family [Dethiosulfatibacter aminovorans DSM 17477]
MYNKNIDNKKLLRLQSLLETAKILNSKQDTDTILRTLLDRCFELLPGGDIGAIFLYNQNTNLLEMRAYSGMGDSVKDVKLKPGESMTGFAFNKREPVFFKDTRTVMKYMDTMEDENTHMTVLAELDSSAVKSSICCPLMHRDQPIGVLVIDNLNESTPLVQDDVEFLEAISVQATIAIVNAQNYEKEVEANRTLSHYTKVIEKERNNYRFSTDIHARFTDMMLNGRTIEDVLEESKNILNLDIFIIDELYNFGYHTSGISDQIDSIVRELPNMIKYLRKNTAMAYRCIHQEKYLHIFPIMVNKESMGWLCIVSDTDKLEELKRITAERASTITALEQLKSSELFNMEQSLKGEFIDNLINNTSPEYIEKCCSQYNIDTNGTYRIILSKMEFNNSSYGNEIEFNVLKSMNRLYKPVGETVKYHFNKSFSVIKGTGIVSLVEIGHSKSMEKIESLIKEIEAKMSEYNSQRGQPVHCKTAVSNSFHGIGNFSKSYNNAEYVLSLMTTYGKKYKRMFYDNLKVKGLLSRNDTTYLESFTDDILGPLLSYPSSHRDEFIRTLETYIRSNCSYTTAKESLGIHGNTLNYRIGKICEILNLDINDYNDRLKIQIAFEIKELLE